MSLLLEALKRAEEDSKKRKLAAADALVLSPALVSAVTPAAVTPEPADQFADVGLTLQDIRPKQDAEPTLFATPLPTPATTETFIAASLETTAFPDLTTVNTDQNDGFSTQGNELKPALSPSALTLAEPIASASKNLVTHPHAKYAKPDSAVAMQLSAKPVINAQVPAQPINTANASANIESKAERVISTPTPASSSRTMATPRQAKSAANVLAGSPLNSGKRKPEKRQVVLAIAAILIALPVAAFLLFGDQLFGTSTLVTSVPARAQPETPVPVSPAVTPEAVAPSLTTEASATLVATNTTTAVVSVAAISESAQVVARPATRQVAAVSAAPTQRSRGKTNTARTKRDDGTAKSTLIDLDRPSSSARASNIQGQPQPTAARRPANNTEAAYAAYQSGNTQEATRLYREVLRLDPTQRDAWLGLAVIAHNNNQREAAMDAYKRVLRLEPQNPTALAGLTSLNNNADEPQQESKLRELLARSPQEADLNHSLALVLSGERRWSEAQQLFFKAHTLAPQEPKFAYNLAVALDQLRRSALAAQYYEVALNLAQGKAPSFDEARARTRLAALRASPSANINTNPTEAKTP